MPSHIPVVYVVFPADPPSLLTPLIYHSPCFLSTLAITLPSPLFNFIFSFTPVFFLVIIHSFSVISHFFPPLCTCFVSLALLLVDFCSFIFLSPSCHIVPHLFLRLPLSYLISTSFLLHLTLMSLISFCRFPPVSLLSSNFYMLVLLFIFLSPSSFHLFLHLLNTSPFYILPLILPPFIPSVEIFSLFITS